MAGASPSELGVRYAGPIPAVPMHCPSAYNPADPFPRPCWTCTWWDGMCAQGSAAQCGQPGGAKTRAQPEQVAHSGSASQAPTMNR